MIADALTGFGKWLLEVLLWVPRKLWAELLDVFAAMFEAMPVPDFIAQAQGYFNAIPPGVLFFANFFALGEGITMVLGAYVLRFLIRRIPFIG